MATPILLLHCAIKIRRSEFSWRACPPADINVCKPPTSSAQSFPRRTRNLLTAQLSGPRPPAASIEPSRPGADLFPRPRGRSKQRRARITEARMHNRRQRPINEIRRQLQQARKDEIAARKCRNHMGDMLFVSRAHPAPARSAPWSTTPAKRPNYLPTGSPTALLWRRCPTTRPSSRQAAGRKSRPRPPRIFMAMLICCGCVDPPANRPSAADRFSSVLRHRI